MNLSENITTFHLMTCDVCATRVWRSMQIENPIIALGSNAMIGRTFFGPETCTDVDHFYY